MLVGVVVGRPGVLVGLVVAVEVGGRVAVRLGVALRVAVRVRVGVLVRVGARVGGGVPAEGLVEGARTPEIRDAERDETDPLVHRASMPSYGTLLLASNQGAVVDVSEELERGRAALARREWVDAYAFLSRADEASPLRAEDIGSLATSAYMLGLDEDELAAIGLE